MTKFNDALKVVAQWVSSHDFEPETIEGNVKIVLDYLKKQNREITLESMNQALAEIKTMVRVHVLDVDADAEDVDADAELDKFVKQIDSWSAETMRENMKDPEVADAVERVLAAKAKQKPKAKPVPKPQSKPVAPKRSAEEIAISKMSADELKRTLSKSPQIAAGIENTLQAAARRQQ